MKTKQLHILVGCADSRDLSQLHVDAVRIVSDKFKELGIEIEFQVIRAAGSFISPDVFDDIKRIIENVQRTTITPDLEYFVHIQTHGHLTEDSNEDYISHVYDLKIVEGSPLNCGMLGAAHVGLELEQMILNEAPEVEIKHVLHKIDTDIKLRMMLKELYAHDGYLAGDWIKSIDQLRSHPRTQRTALENAIKYDASLKSLNIKITAGIMDYSIHSLIRVDGGDPEVPFWDDVQMYVRKHAENERHSCEFVIKQSEKQKPLAGLLSMADPKMSSRLFAAEFYYEYKGIKHEGNYLPNTIFNITGSSFDLPHIPFGPYVIAGFFYAVKHLHLIDQMVMGYNKEQTDRIIQKIYHDPMMSLIVKKFNVNLIPVNHVEVKHEIETDLPTW